MAQYLGEQKIHTIEKLETGESKITLKDGVAHILPDAVLDKMITEEKVNWKNSSVNDYKLAVISEDLLGLLRDHYKIGVKELDRLIVFITNKSNNDYNVAQQLLWGKGIYDLKLADVQTVLEKGVEDEKEKMEKQAHSFNAERAIRR